MDPTQQEEKKQQGINVPNIPIPGMGRMGRSGAKLAGQAGKLIAQAGARAGTALLTTPVGWVILAVAAVFIITFAIVFYFGNS